LGPEPLHRDVPSDPDDPGETSARDVIAAARRFHRLLRPDINGKLAGPSLSYAQYEVLEILEAEPKLHAGELARCLKIRRQSVHRLVAQLVRGDLVDVLPKDGGIRGIRLTPTGRRRLATCRKALEGTEGALGSLPAATRSSLVEALGACEAALAPPPSPFGGGTSPCYSSGAKEPPSICSASSRVRPDRTGSPSTCWASSRCRASQYSGMASGLMRTATFR